MADSYYKAEAEKLSGELLNLIETKRFDVLKAFVINYTPTWIDTGQRLDRALRENERLQAIADLIALKNENDELKRKLHASQL